MRCLSGSATLESTPLRSFSAFFAVTPGVGAVYVRRGGLFISVLLF